MKKKRLILLALGSSIALTGVLLQSCSKKNNDSSATSAAVAKSKAMTDMASLSDADYFKGVIFLDGPVVAQLEDFADYSITALTDDAGKIEKVNKFRDQILEQIQSKDPSFLQQFRTKIQSGDLEQVRQGLSDASAMVAQATATVAGITQEQLAQSIGVVAENFSTNYHLDNSTSKDDMIGAVKAELSSYDCIVLYCNVVLYPMPLINISPGTYITQKTTSFNTYEAERFASLVILKLAK